MSLSRATEGTGFAERLGTRGADGLGAGGGNRRGVPQNQNLWHRCPGAFRDGDGDRVRLKLGRGVSGKEKEPGAVPRASCLTRNSSDAPYPNPSPRRSSYS